MALRIGFDLDGVLADMEQAIVREATTLFGSTPPSPHEGPGAIGDLVPEEIAPVRNEMQLTTRQRRQLWRHLRSIDNFWESLDEIEPASVARLARMAETRRWEIIFLTRRPATAGRTAQVQSQRWLEKGFPLPSVFVVTGSRGLIATALTLDIVVDDTPENCVDVASDSKARTIAIFRDQDRQPPPFSARWGSMSSTRRHSASICWSRSIRALHNRPGRLERVMRTLGLKESTSA